MNDTVSEQITDEPTIDVKTAVKTVSPPERNRALMLLGAAGVTLAVLFGSRLLWLFKPLFAKVYYGTLTVILYYGAVAILFIAYTVALNVFVKRCCGVRLFAPKAPHMDVKRTLAVIALCAATVFFIGLGLNFKVKIQVEMGSGVTMATALTNIAVYVYYAIHIFMGLTAASLVQHALTVLIPTKHTVPWDAVFMVTVFGLTELFLETLTTAHMYPWLYYILTYVYSAVYIITGRSFHVSFWTFVIVMVL